MSIDDRDLPRPLVGTDWLAARLAAPDLRILDCTVVLKAMPDGSYGFGSGVDEYRAAHIPGAVFCDVVNELRDPDNPLPLMLPAAEAFSATMSRLGVGADTRVVLYDRGNHAWAARVWWNLRVYGFDLAAVLDGGLRKWQAEGRPASSAPGSYPPGRFVARFRPGLLARRKDVLAALGSADTSIINALSPEEFRGERSRFPRAGRIPGTHNVHCDSLLDPQALTYLPPDRLRERFEPSGALRAGHVITYCGGGVAASSDALALAVLGRDDVAVYDGSLSEWTADPGLPMETG